MSEYHLHDKPDGRPAVAAQLWRDAHTVDEMAAKFRVHIRALRAFEDGYDWVIPELTKARGPDGGEPLAVVEWQL